MKECDKVSNPDEHHPGKMFVGGLSWQTTPEKLKEYFSQFGSVSEATVMRDPATKRSRGFGFVSFTDPAIVDQVLDASGGHHIDQKKVDPKPAVPRKAQPKMVTKTKKLFVGGVSTQTTVEHLRNYFGQFGKIDEIMLMVDKTTQRHRGFGFVTFDSEDVVDDICDAHYHEINGKVVECKKAQPKEVMLPLVMANRARNALSQNFSFLPANACHLPLIQSNSTTLFSNIYQRSGGDLPVASAYSPNYIFPSMSVWMPCQNSIRHRPSYNHYGNYMYQRPPPYYAYPPPNIFGASNGMAAAIHASPPTTGSVYGNAVISSQNASSCIGLPQQNSPGATPATLLAASPTIDMYTAPQLVPNNSSPQQEASLAYLQASNVPAQALPSLNMTQLIPTYQNGY